MKEQISQTLDTISSRFGAFLEGHLRRPLGLLFYDDYETETDGLINKISSLGNQNRFISQEERESPQFSMPLNDPIERLWLLTQSTQADRKAWMSIVAYAEENYAWDDIQRVFQLGGEGLLESSEARVKLFGIWRAAQKDTSGKLMKAFHRKIQTVKKQTEQMENSRTREMINTKEP